HAEGKKRQRAQTFQLQFARGLHKARRFEAPYLYSFCFWPRLMNQFGQCISVTLAKLAEELTAEHEGLAAEAAERIQHLELELLGAQQETKKLLEEKNQIASEVFDSFHDDVSALQCNSDHGQPLSMVPATSEPQSMPMSNSPNRTLLGSSVGLPSRPASKQKANLPGQPSEDVDQPPALKSDATESAAVFSLHLFSGAQDEDTDNPSSFRSYLQRLQPVIVSPQSSFRMTWDAIASITIMYESVAVPLFFFGIQSSTTVKVCSWFLRVFWSIDLPLSCLTGYFRLGDQPEMRADRVILTYLRTWALPDTLLLLLDWLEPLLATSNGQAPASGRKFLTAARLFKLMRLWRLLRRITLPDVFFVRLLKSDIQVVVFGMVRSLIFLLWVNHVMACIFYGLASSDMDEGSWVKDYGMLTSEPSLDAYIAALYWSLSNFTGSTNIYPVSQSERIYGIVCLFLAFMLSAMLVSSITSSLTRLEIATAKVSGKLSSLKRYLNDNDISSNVSMRVQRNAGYALQEQQKRTPEAEVELLSLISEPLRVELNFEIRMPHLKCHPFFEFYGMLCPTLMRQVCHTCLCRLSPSRGDVLFSAQEDSEQQAMFVVANGRLNYYRMNELDHGYSNSAPEVLREGDWAAEQVLWTNWTHRGMLRAKTDCVIITLQARSFHSITQNFQSNLFYPIRYGQAFVQNLNATLPDELTDLEDKDMNIRRMAYGFCFPQDAIVQGQLQNKCKDLPRAIPVGCSREAFCLRARAHREARRGQEQTAEAPCLSSSCFWPGLMNQFGHRISVTLAKLAEELTAEHEGLAAEAAERIQHLELELLGVQQETKKLLEEKNKIASEVFDSFHDKVLDHQCINDHGQPLSVVPAFSEPQLMPMPSSLNRTLLGSSALLCNHDEVLDHQCINDHGQPLSVVPAFCEPQLMPMPNSPNRPLLGSSALLCNQDEVLDHQCINDHGHPLSVVPALCEPQLMPMSNSSNRTRFGSSVGLRFKIFRSASQPPANLPGQPSEAVDQPPALKSDATESAVFSLHPFWQQRLDSGKGLLSKDYKKSALRSFATSRGPICDNKSGGLDEDTDNPRSFRSCLQRLQPVIVSPQSSFRMTWDAIASITIMYESVAIPLFFFGIQSSTTVKACSWFLRVFWSIDLPLSCLTGYFRLGDQPEMRADRVILTYLRTWALPDTLLLLLDWLEPLLATSNGQAPASGRKFLTAARLFKLMRLWRLLRRITLPDAVFVRLGKSDIQLVVFGMVRSLIFLLWVNHVMACIFYGLASSDMDEGSWVKDYGMLTSEPSLDAYIAALYWSLGNFTGSTNIYPVSQSERIYGIVCLFLAFMLSAMLVSSITSSLTRLEIATAKVSGKLNSLKRYLNDNDISSHVSMRVQRNAAYALQEQQKRTPEAEVELLSLISEPLRVELNFEMRMPHLQCHPFFEFYGMLCPTLMRQVCHTCLCRLSPSRGDVLFSAQEDSEQQAMFVVANGRLNYYRMNELVHGYSNSVPEVLREGDWAAEQVLWTNWTHRGMLRAKTDCVIITLQARSFHSITQNFQSNLFYPIRYGQAFVQRLNATLPDELTDLEDKDMNIRRMAYGFCFPQDAIVQGQGRRGQVAPERPFCLRARAHREARRGQEQTAEAPCLSSSCFWPGLMNQFGHRISVTLAKIAEELKAEHEGLAAEAAERIQHLELELLGAQQETKKLLEENNKIASEVFESFHDEVSDHKCINDHGQPLSVVPAFSEPQLMPMPNSLNRTLLGSSALLCNHDEVLDHQCINDHGQPLSVVPAFCEPQLMPMSNSPNRTLLGSRLGLQFKISRSASQPNADLPGQPSEAVDQPPALKSDATESAADTDNPSSFRSYLQRLQPVIVSPQSSFRMTWDAIASIAIMYESVAIPLFFFGIQSSTTVKPEMRADRVVLTYLRTWALPDTLLLLLDWLEPLLATSDGQAPASGRKFLTAARLFKLMRLWRLLRRITLPDAVFVRLGKSDIQLVVFGMVRSLIFLLWVNHVMACIFYGLALSDMDEGNWVKDYGMLTSEPSLDAYIAALSWSLSNFTGSTNIYPVSQSERIYGIVCLFLAFMLSAMLVSSITSSLTRLEMATAKVFVKLNSLKRYLNDNDISSHVSMRVQRNATYALQEQQKRTPEAEVELLSLISEPLRVELNFEIRMPHLKCHPFFEFYGMLCPTLMRQVCHTCLCRLSPSRGDVLFSAQEDSEQQAMFVVADGRLNYYRMNELDHGYSNSVPEVLREGDWAAEQVLWTNWTHRGMLRAKTDCVIITLQARSFHSITQNFQSNLFYPILYGQAFVQKLNATLPDELTDLEDKDMNIRRMAYGFCFPQDEIGQGSWPEHTERYAEGKNRRLRHPA
ncbi:unnamed protein product, partial [Polarella glacialis]